MGMIPPPPPPSVFANLPKDETDALSAMLIGWYMSGFHTGRLCDINFIYFIYNRIWALMICN